MFFLLFFTLCYSCHPQCRWACDDPVCNAVCHYQCHAPVCQTQCISNSTRCYGPSCSVRCPPNQCESDSCPNCETVCNPPSCFNPQTYEPVTDCQNLCEATNCSWKCEKPTNCPYPKCQLMCEQPACQSSGTRLGVGMLIFGIVLLVGI